MACINDLNDICVLRALADPNRKDPIPIRQTLAIWSDFQNEMSPSLFDFGQKRNKVDSRVEYQGSIGLPVQRFRERDK